MNKNDSDQPQWRRMRFKKNKVWVAIDGDGHPIQQKGKLLIKYQLDQDHEYWVNPANVRPTNEKTEVHTVQKHTPAEDSSEQTSQLPNDNAVHIYTDGASSGNPGPAGIGIFMEYRGQVKEISKFIGHATNNVAELEAIRTGLLELKKKNLPIVIYTDSTYAQGVLSFGWKARKNRSLVDEIKNLIGAFKDVKLVKVRGHAGHPQNERADRLARMAVVSGNVHR